MLARHTDGVGSLFLVGQNDFGCRDVKPILGVVKSVWEKTPAPLSLLAHQFCYLMLLMQS